MQPTNLIRIADEKVIVKEQTLMELVNSALNVFLIIGGLAIFAMIVYSGFLFVTSQGNADKVTQARNTLTYAIIGVVLVVFSFAIMIYLKSQINK